MAKQAIFDKPNSVVIGGAGFIGSHLCDELLASGKVICIDNFATGDRDNIAHLLQQSNFKLINHDISRPLSLEQQPELEEFRVAFQGIQTIYYVASPSSPTAYSARPIEALQINSTGLQQALDWAVQYKSQLIYVTSAAVYGQAPAGELISESYLGLVDHFSPRGYYAAAERFGEALVAQYRIRHGLDAKIARLSNVYGPRLQLTDGRMIPELIRMATAGEDIVIHGQPDDAGSYLYVGDAVKALLRLAETTEAGPINIGSEWQHRYSDIAAAIVALTNPQAKITYEERTPLMSQQILLDITLAKERLGWFPVVLLEEGLKLTADYLSAQQHIREPKG